MSSLPAKSRRDDTLLTVCFSLRTVTTRSFTEWISRRKSLKLQYLVYFALLSVSLKAAVCKRKKPLLSDCLQAMPAMRTVETDNARSVNCYRTVLIQQAYLSFFSPWIAELSGCIPDCRSAVARPVIPVKAGMTEKPPKITATFVCNWKISRTFAP